MNVLFALIVILQVASIVPYIAAILRRQAQPVMATWLIWATLDTVTFLGMYAKGALNAQIIAVIGGAWCIALLSLKLGRPGWTRVDKLCLFGAAIAVALWAASGDAALALVTSLTATFLGAIPTFVSAWQDPRRENKVAWTIGTAACIGAMFAVPRWTIADAAQPITFFLIQIVMVYILYVHGARLPLPVSVTDEVKA